MTIPNFQKHKTVDKCAKVWKCCGRKTFRRWYIQAQRYSRCFLTFYAEISFLPPYGRKHGYAAVFVCDIGIPFSFSPREYIAFRYTDWKF